MEKDQELERRAERTQQPSQENDQTLLAAESFAHRPRSFRSGFERTISGRGKEGREKERERAFGSTNRSGSFSKGIANMAMMARRTSSGKSLGMALDEDDDKEEEADGNSEEEATLKELIDAQVAEEPSDSPIQAPTAPSANDSYPAVRPTMLRRDILAMKAQSQNRARRETISGFSSGVEDPLYSSDVTNLRSIPLNRPRSVSVSAPTIANAPPKAPPTATRLENSSANVSSSNGSRDSALVSGAGVAAHSADVEKSSESITTSSMTASSVESAPDSSRIASSMMSPAAALLAGTANLFETVSIPIVRPKDSKEFKDLSDIKEPLVSPALPTFSSVAFNVLNQNSDIKEYQRMKGFYKQVMEESRDISKQLASAFIQMKQLADKIDQYHRDLFEVMGNHPSSSVVGPALVAAYQDPELLAQSKPFDIRSASCAHLLRTLAMDSASIVSGLRQFSTATQMFLETEINPMLAEFTSQHPGAGGGSGGGTPGSAASTNLYSSATSKLLHRKTTLHSAMGSNSSHLTSQSTEVFGARRKFKQIVAKAGSKRPGSGAVVDDSSSSPSFINETTSEEPAASLSKYAHQTEFDKVPSMVDDLINSLHKYSENVHQESTIIMTNMRKSDLESLRDSDSRNPDEADPRIKEMEDTLLRESCREPPVDQMKEQAGSPVDYQSLNFVHLRDLAQLIADNRKGPEFVRMKYSALNPDPRRLAKSTMWYMTMLLPKEEMIEVPPIYAGSEDVTRSLLSCSAESPSTDTTTAPAKFMSLETGPGGLALPQDMNGDVNKDVYATMPNMPLTIAVHDSFGSNASVSTNSMSNDQPKSAPEVWNLKSSMSSNSKATITIQEAETCYDLYIVIRGTDFKNLKHLLLDADSKWEFDPIFNIRLHRGFRTAARELYDDLISTLTTRYSDSKQLNIRITGHSLGASVGTILGAYLLKNCYSVKEIVSFASPKLTDYEGGQELLKLFARHGTKYLRINHYLDIVRTLPKKPDFRSFGPVLLVFEDLSSWYFDAAPLQEPFHYVNYGDALSHHRTAFYSDMMNQVLEKILVGRG